MRSAYPCYDAARYRRPPCPYPSQGVRAAVLRWEVLTNDPTALDDEGFELIQLGPNGQLTTIVYAFYDDAPPAPPTVGINVTGANTPDLIAAAIVATLRATGWRVEVVNPVRFLVYQPFAGATGNTETTILDTSLDELFLWNGLDYDLAEETPMFHNGADALPVRYGEPYGFAPSNGETALSAPVGEGA